MIIRLKLYGNGIRANVEGALAVLVDLMNANAFTMTRQPYGPNYKGLVDALIDLKEGFPLFSPTRVGFDVNIEDVADGDALISGPAMARLVKHWLMEP